MDFKRKISRSFQYVKGDEGRLRRDMELVRDRWIKHVAGGTPPGVPRYAYLHMTGDTRYLVVNYAPRGSLAQCARRIGCTLP